MFEQPAQSLVATHLANRFGGFVTWRRCASVGNRHFPQPLVRADGIVVLHIGKLTLRLRGWRASLSFHGVTIDPNFFTHGQITSAYRHARERIMDDDYVLPNYGRRFRHQPVVHVRKDNCADAGMLDILKKRRFRWRTLFAVE